MSKEHAYAYEAGYRDGAINYELDHCPACKNVADLQEVLEENAKLREQIHWLKQGDILHVLTDQEYIDQCERERLMQVSIDALDKENAKLRELIRELFRDFANADYELKSRCGRTFMAVTRYLPRLQELEVEP